MKFTIKPLKAVIAASAALIMGASLAACGPSAASPSDASSSDNITASSSAKARTLD